MNTVIETHCKTALDSPYSRDRADAIEELRDAFSGAGTDGKNHILETLRQIAHESRSRSERELARETLRVCFDDDPATAEHVVVDTFSDLAKQAKFSEERLDAIDTLRNIYPDIGEDRQDAVGRCLAEIAGNATYEDERRRARQRLSDVSREERQSSAERRGSGAATDDAISYLGKSLAEHLEQAANEGSKACLQRAQEVSEFLEENPVRSDSYSDVSEDVESLVEQLRVVPTGADLDEERTERVERLAGRVERLYARN